MKRAGFAVLALLAACRPDPGVSDYENHGPLEVPDGGGGSDSEMLPGPFPYVAGQPRLAVGFYEGGRSEEIAVDNTTTFVYLYDNTVTIEPSTTRVEGKTADLLVHAGKAWMGMGVHWTTPRNLSTWKTLHVSLRSSDPGFSSVKLKMEDADKKGVEVNAEKFGYANDGEWHHLAIPLSEFTATGMKLTIVNAPFIFLGGQGAPADKLLLDNVYFTAE